MFQSKSCMASINIPVMFISNIRSEVKKISEWVTAQIWQQVTESVNTD